MNRKGFTLVEVIGVLTLLALIVLVAFPSILGAMKKADEGMNEATNELLIANAKSYWADNTIRIEENGETYCVTIKELIQQNYTKTPISTVDSEEAKKIEDSYCVVAQYNSGWDYELTDSCGAC